MGIRFFCPNGHKLNVKSHLAGKAGFCPECGIRLIVPYESTRKSSKELADNRDPALDFPFQTESTKPYAEPHAFDSPLPEPTGLESSPPRETEREKAAVTKNFASDDFVLSFFDEEPNATQSVKKYGKCR